MNEKNNEKKWFLLIIALLLISFSILFILYRPGHDDNGILIGAGVKKGEIEPDTGEKANGNEEGTGINGRSNMTVKLNGYPVFEDGKSEGSLNIVNPDSNMLYMLVDITLDETGEKIYESGAIPPDHYIDNDKLEKNSHRTHTMQPLMSRSTIRMIRTNNLTEQTST